MQTTLKAVYLALQIGPLLALVFALPYTLREYVKTKSINVWRCTYFYTFVLYFLCAYFITMLPLPSRESLQDMRPVRELVQLIPFKSVADIRQKTLLRDVAIIAFNVLLTVPLGYFVRVLFKQDLKKTVLIGFLAAALYEVTQLTGLFFIYPRPWRVFDVDDLITNTLGALVGYLIAPVVSRFLPKHSDTKAQRLVQGSEVSFAQRAFAGAVDFCVVFAGALLVILSVPPLHKTVTEGLALERFPVFFALILASAGLYAALMGGRTLGYRATGLRLLTKGSRAASRRQSVMRMLLIYAFVLALPFWILFFMSIYTEYAGAKSILWMLCAAGLMLCAARNLLEMLFNAVTHGSSMFYDRLLHTYAAYGNSTKTSLFGIRVIDIKPLERDNVDGFSEKICAQLAEAGFGREAVTKVRLMAEGVLLDWIDAGLDGTLCELRLDKRFRHKSVMLSVYGEDRTDKTQQDTYVDMLKAMNLQLETYYAGGKNICIIHIPT